MQQMLTTELASIVGAKHAKLGTDRVGNWHGTTHGQVVLGGRKMTVERPRGRYVDGGEVSLATWQTFASEDVLRQIVVERPADSLMSAPPGATMQDSPADTNEYA